MYTLEVLNPVSQKMGEIEVSRPAARPRSLDGLTVGLVWNAKRGGDTALLKAGALIGNRFQNVNVIRYDGSQPCQVGVLERVKSEADVVVGSTGD